MLFWVTNFHQTTSVSYFFSKAQRAFLFGDSKRSTKNSVKEMIFKTVQKDETKHLANSASSYLRISPSDPKFQNKGFEFRLQRLNYPNELT